MAQQRLKRELIQTFDIWAVITTAALLIGSQGPIFAIIRQSPAFNSLYALGVSIGLQALILVLTFTFILKVRLRISIFLFLFYIIAGFLILTLYNYIFGVSFAYSTPSYALSFVAIFLGVRFKDKLFFKLF